MKTNVNLFLKVTNNMVEFLRPLGYGVAYKQNTKHPKVKMQVDVQHLETRVKSKIMQTYSNCRTNFMDELVRFPKELKTFKPIVVNDNEWHEHKPKMNKSRLYDPFGVSSHKRLNYLQRKLKAKRLTKT